MLNPSLEVKTRDGYLVAEFWDCLRLDPQPVRELRQAYQKHTATGGKTAVLVDLNGVGFAGSSALSGFISLRKAGARVIFFHVEPTVREVFRVGSLESLFQFAADEDEALTLAGASPAPPSPPAQPGASPAPPRAGSPPLRRSQKRGS